MTVASAPVRVAEVITGVPTDLIVGGDRRAASDGSTFQVLDPATGQPLARVADGTVDDAIACVDAAAGAAAAWAATPPRKRSEILRATHGVAVLITPWNFPAAMGAAANS